MSHFGSKACHSSDAPPPHAQTSLHRAHGSRIAPSRAPGTVRHLRLSRTPRNGNESFISIYRAGNKHRFATADYNQRDAPLALRSQVGEPRLAACSSEHRTLSGAPLRAGGAPSGPGFACGSGGAWQTKCTGSASRGGTGDADERWASAKASFASDGSPGPPHGDGFLSAFQLGGQCPRP